MLCNWGSKRSVCKNRFFQLGQTKIELLESIDPEGPIASFIEKRGEGIHHIAFEVDNADEALNNAKENGFRLNPDQKVVEKLIKGLLANEKKHGERYCPCRRIVGNKDEDSSKICPCKWHKEEIKRDGHCFCGLFLE